MIFQNSNGIIELPWPGKKTKKKTNVDLDESEQRFEMAKKKNEATISITHPYKCNVLGFFWGGGFSCDKKVF